MSGPGHSNPTVAPPSLHQREKLGRVSRSAQKEREKERKDDIKELCYMHIIQQKPKGFTECGRNIKRKRKRT